MKQFVIAFLISCLLLLIGSFYLYNRYTKESSFCTVNVRAPWYTTYIEIDEMTLPEGIQEIRLSEKEFSYGLLNTTETPLYLVTDYTKSSDEYIREYPNSELPSIYTPLFKATQDEILYYFKDESTNKFGWQSNAGNRTNELGHVVEITPFLLERMGNELKNVYLDNRPSDISLPQKHPVFIKTYYQNKLYEIEGEAIYQKNNRYDEMIATKKQTNCHRHFLITEFTEYLLLSLQWGLILVTINILVLGYYAYKKITTPSYLLLLPILYGLTLLVFLGIAQFIL